MGKCKFCYFYENGDIPSDREDLICKQGVKLSDLKISCSDAKGTLKIQKSFSAYVSIGNDSKNNAELWLGCFDGETDEIVLSKSKRINYCPICGRKLNE